MIALYEYRKRLGLTQAQLADKLGVRKSTIGMWETGNRKPNIVMLKKLAGFFECTTDELLKPTKTE